MKDKLPLSVPAVPRKGAFLVLAKDDGKQRRIVASVQSFDDAEFIVKACNAYNGLVTALKDTCEILSHRYQSRSLLINEAKRFIDAEAALREAGEL